MNIFTNDSEYKLGIVGIANDLLLEKLEENLTKLWKNLN